MMNPPVPKFPLGDEEHFVPVSQEEQILSSQVSTPQELSTIGGYSEMMSEFAVGHPTIAQSIHPHRLESTSRVASVTPQDYSSQPSNSFSSPSLTPINPGPIRQSSGPLNPPSRSLNGPPNISSSISSSMLRPDMILQTQELIADRYQITKKIGQGGMGQVFAALDTCLQREVVIKVAHNQGEGPSPEDQARFNREAIKMASLNHPNIVIIYDYGRHNESQFLVMELIHGETLKSKMSGSEVVSKNEFLEIVTQLLEGVQEAHDQDVIHRDLKPSNLMWDAERKRLKILDFGLARGVEGDTVTQTGHVHGSIQYMAPEQIRGEAQGPATDLYAVGILCFQILTHSLPFRGDNTVELMFQKLQHDPHPLLEQDDTPYWVTPALANLIERCLKLKPSDRPESAIACLEELKSIIKIEPTDENFSTRSEMLHTGAISIPSLLERPTKPWLDPRVWGGALALSLVAYLLGTFSDTTEEIARVNFKFHKGSEITGSELSIDGKMHGNLPIELELPIGAHEVVLKYEGTTQTQSYEFTTGNHVIWMTPPSPQLELALPQPGSISHENESDSHEVLSINEDDQVSPVQEVVSSQLTTLTTSKEPSIKQHASQKRGKARKRQRNKTSKNIAKTGIAKRNNRYNRYKSVSTSKTSKASKTSKRPQTTQSGQKTKSDVKTTPSIDVPLIVD